MQGVSASNDRRFVASDRCPMIAQAMISIETLSRSANREAR